MFEDSIIANALINSFTNYWLDDRVFSLVAMSVGSNSTGSAYARIAAKHLQWIFSMAKIVFAPASFQQSNNEPNETITYRNRVLLGSGWKCADILSMES